MTLAVIAWQIIIFVTIAFSGTKRGWITAAWTLWTFFQVVTLPLSIIQFATVFFAYQISKPSVSSYRSPPLSGRDMEPFRPAEERYKAPTQEPAPTPEQLYNSETDEFTVLNCKFRYKCKKNWGQLTSIPGTDDVKFCGTCRESVYFCHTASDLDINTRAGRCVAVMDENGDDLLGDVL